MYKRANTKKELSCIIANLFQSLEMPCEKCKENKDALIITGKTYQGNKATIYIQKMGIYYLEGSPEVEEELQGIRGGRCLIK